MGAAVGRGVRDARGERRDLIGVVVVVLLGEHDAAEVHPSEGAVERRLDGPAVEPDQQQLRDLAVEWQLGDELADLRVRVDTRQPAAGWRDQPLEEGARGERRVQRGTGRDAVFRAIRRAAPVDLSEPPDGERCHDPD